MSNPTFSILVTTKNRKNELAFILDKITYLLSDFKVEIVVFDDGSTDHTSEFIKENYPNIILLRNQFSKGLIYCRNQMLNQTKAKYAISLDDDAHFVTENVLQHIETHFSTNPNCGVIAFRIFWGLALPSQTFSDEKPLRVKGFVGCAHVWRMEAWRDIPNYPEWFVFYGEEDFAAFKLFKKGWEIHYFPEVLVHHIVDIKARKKEKDYQLRLRRSLRSGWYLYFLFYPWQLIPRKLAYTLWIQLKTKVLKGDVKALFAILQAIFDVLVNIPRLLKNSNRLTMQEYEAYNNLPNTSIYWNANF